jgi:alkylation response protein AidB-like acyl-CoA dehydrogenase
VSARVSAFPVGPESIAHASECDGANGTARRFRAIVGGGRADLPAPGSGRTPDRFSALSALAADDLSVARLVEAHADAAAICAEAGHAGLRGEETFAVWASDGPGSRLEAIAVPGGWCLTGTKRFCSGSTIVDQALVTAHAPDGLRLFTLPLGTEDTHVETGEWATAAFAAVATGTVHVKAVVPEEAAVGGPGFYLARPGFWHGAVGVAACWAGGAQGLLDRYARHHWRDDPHAIAAFGATQAACWTMRAVLHRAAVEIDGDPLDQYGAGMRRALLVRHIIEQACQDVLARLARAAGPRATAFDPWFAQQSADLAIYLQQCHGERDLEALGRLGIPDQRRVNGG